MSKHLARRDFLQVAGAVVAAGTMSIRAEAVSPNGKLRTAHIGVGGMGGADLRSISSHPMVEVAALCDVDSNRLEEAAKAHAQAKKFRDFRKLYDSMSASEIDAVVVSTTEHTHAYATLPALLMKKPVYCEKPLTHNVAEARLITKAAADALFRR